MLVDKNDSHGVDGDSLHAQAARDAETHDSNFASYYWNISQNVTREKHRSVTPGIAGWYVKCDWVACEH